jgi:hypothetical protein
MPPSPFVIAGLTTATVVLAGARLVLSETVYHPSSGALLACGLLLLTVVSLAAFLVGRTRWSRYALYGCVGAALAAGSAGDASLLWWLLAATSVAALIGLIGPWPDRWLRRLPPADGPPAAATALLVALIATPAFSGFAAPLGTDRAVWAWSAWCVVLALSLGRAVPGSLAAARWLHPLLGLLAALLAGAPQGFTVAAAALAATTLAWTKDVRLAVAPPAQDRGVVPFPPELVAPEILAAAGLDDRGRPRGDQP